MHERCMMPNYYKSTPMMSATCHKFP